ncbi:hypothetical protein [Luteimonas sp. MC1895]|uniref:hypothetical protein n=1 Tax=Luteimonas sp. MC1895 TaxID=2819513 RepID=UPI0018F0D704|nr:hypothetical protein [Luteimonas sp. MC1895]MBJ6978760.1 hypothetical protein [Luteimonas sp. MC1895]
MPRKPRNHNPFSTLLLPVLLLGAGLGPAGAEAAPRRATYVDASSYLQDEVDFEAWFTLRRQLRLNFDAICGDTFCEGDYTNIQALRFVCSVQRLTGRVGECAWSFAASEESVDPARGRIGLDAPAWLCRSPLAPGTTIEALLDALQGEEPLYAALPGTALTLYDGLVDCL